MFRPSGRGRLRNKLADSGERNLRPDDVVEVQGLRVTTPLRTAWDLERVRWTDEAITGLDAMLRLGAFTRSELVAGIERFRGMRWGTVLRMMAPLADERSESPGESVLRMRCLEVGVHVVPQLEVLRDGVLIARLDLGDEASRLGLSTTAPSGTPVPRSWSTTGSAGELADDGRVICALDVGHVFGRERTCDALIRDAAARARAGRPRWLAS